ncbi:hypothetical protein [Thauera phenolivorans]|uniref:hypothetical protein n=1 Tax=Thauera phenolivorans TaxID=1792543 RepID=UPI00083A1E48|nr:hypothetical protein [Thauera phenolivorans]
MNFTKGPARVSLPAAEVAALRSVGALIEDPRRERPRYFDGRFLAARDLIRDQQYILTREADLGQAAGSGVAAGLEVEPGSAGDRLRVGAGHGVTPAGELVLLPREIELRLSDVPRAEQLSARFGLGRIPHPPLRSRTGLFVLALRPVEFTGGPVGAYPTSITGPRTVEDGDIIEATAVVLVPWDDDGAADAPAARRGHAAATIFAAGGGRALSSNVLPLAMVALQNNLVVWVDAPMVRRELGADRADLPGLGHVPRALRLAHLLQHQLHLADLLRDNGGQPFAAHAHFAVLPPAGPLPPGLIDSADFTQRYFPPEMAVDFSIIPEDELPALVEEALSLPPIDLEADSETLEATSVLILAPVPRNQWRAVSSRLSTHIQPLRPAAINLVATRRPLEILQKLRLPRVPPALAPADPSTAEWARLAAMPDLWFVRRRNLAYRDELAGAAVRVAGRETLRVDVIERLGTIGLDGTLNRVFERATPLAASEAASLLASPRIADSPTLTAAALSELSRAETIDQATVLRVAADLSAPGVGDGLVRLERARADAVPSTPALREIADGGDWRGADTSAATATRAELVPLANSVLRLQPVRPRAGEGEGGGGVVRPRGAPKPADAADAGTAEAATKAATKAARSGVAAPATAGASKKAPAAKTAAAANRAKVAPGEGGEGGKRAATSPSGRRRKPAGGAK